MEQPFCVKYLTEPEIDYELRIRNIRATRKTIQVKRIILQNLINKGTAEVLSLKDPDFDKILEKTAIDQIILELEVLVGDFSASKQDTSYNIIISRLNSLTNRVRRFIIPDEPEKVHDTYSEFKDNALATCFEIQANLDLKILPETEIKQELLNQTTVNKSIPVYKWGLQYDG